MLALTPILLLVVLHLAGVVMQARDARDRRDRP
jgi:hypothetical protein